MCERVARCLPTTCRPILSADRGFATTRFFRFLDALGWDGIIRAKGNILVQWAGRWVPLTILGKSRPVQRDGQVFYAKAAEDGPYAGRFVVYADQNHSDPWFLMVSAGLAERPTGAIVAGYGQRFIGEESYKDQKNDPGEGFPRDCAKLGTAARWDRLGLVFAWASYWLNVAGWDREARDGRSWRNPRRPKHGDSGLKTVKRGKNWGSLRAGRVKKQHKNKRHTD